MTQTRWSRAQVLDLAPDAASVAAARTLLRPGSWSDTGSTDLLVWGKCQGSGKTPYQVSVDLSGPAFRCSCPSRKFPCKHALALLLMWTDGTLTAGAEPAAYAQEWVADRAAAGQARATRAESTPDPAAQARRLEERLSLMTAGLEDFGRWLADVVRGGTASARQQPYAWWDATAARLVDAQLPGLAEQVRAMAGDIHRRSDWDEHLLAGLARWWTASRAWSGRDTLPPAAQADLRAFLGWAQPTADVRAADQLAGRFAVLGGHRTEDGRLQQQRTWLRAEESGEWLQVLDFAVGGAPLAVPQLAGTVLQTTLSRYPGSAPRRALLGEDTRPVGRLGDLGPGVGIDAALASRAARLGESPWSDLVPIVLAQVSFVTGEPAAVCDQDGGRLTLVEDAPVWLLLALTGGRPADVFGELESGSFRPLSLADADGLVPL